MFAVTARRDGSGGELADSSCIAAANDINVKEMEMRLPLSTNFDVMAEGVGSDIRDTMPARGEVPAPVRGSAATPSRQVGVGWRVRRVF
jgi:hypothetical protein